MNKISQGLLAPFTDADLEWKVQTCGETNGRVWALIVPYVSNRAIQDRLDQVVGCDKWRNEFAKGPDGGVLCGLSILFGSEWVTKWDGAENTDIEPVKGGLSNAMKRAAVQWGIGRHLYSLPVFYAEIGEDKKKYPYVGRTKEKKTFHWRPPLLDVPQEEKKTKPEPSPEPEPEPDPERTKAMKALHAAGASVGLDHNAVADRARKVTGIDFQSMSELTIPELRKVYADIKTNGKGE